jgi:pentatricopeptide repeat protein
MIVKDRVMPTAFAYTVIIDAMAKYGYPQGAFRLFRKVKYVSFLIPSFLSIIRDVKVC